MHEVKVTIGRERTAPEKTSRLILGNFIELGLGRQVSGMWGEMIYNRSFQTVPPLKPIVWEWLRFSRENYDARAPFWHSGYEEIDWEPLASEGMHLHRTQGFEPFRGNDSLGIRNERAGVEAGLRQRGIHLRTGTRCRFTLFGAFHGRKTTVPSALVDPARDSPPETRDVVIRLRDEASPNRLLVHQALHLLATQGRHELEFDTAGFSGRAILEICFTWEGVLMLSSCSLMPMDNISGWRADVVGLLRKVSPPVIRFPGGCFASFYDWRDGIGPRDCRAAREPYFWGGLEENDVGIDEYLTLCELLGSEAQVCVNMMTGSPHAAAQLVEYCNGPDSSPMGRVRRELGVERRTRVRYWEMDNEAGRKWSALQYAEKVVEFARRMRGVDPRITIMMEYYSWGIDVLPRMLEVAGKDVDIVIHRDGDPSFIGAALAIIRDYNLKNGARIRQANTEWLPDFNAPEPFEEEGVPQSYDWEPSGDDYRKTLNFRQIRWFYALNAASRILDYISYGGEFALANFNNCVNTWGQNIIEAAKEKAWLSAAGRVFEFFRGFDAAYPLVTTCDRYERAFLNLQACEPRDGEIDLFAVNKGRDPVVLSIQLPAGYAPLKARVLDAAHRLAANTRELDGLRLREYSLGERVLLDPLSLTHVACRAEQ